MPAARYNRRAFIRGFGPAVFAPLCVLAAGLPGVEAGERRIVAVLESPSSTPDLDQFGAAVAIEGGLAVVGARYEDPGGFPFAGRAYVFDAASGALATRLENPEPEPGDNFGVSTALSGDLAAVGAYHDKPGGVSNAGSAYVFNTRTGELVSVLDNPDPDAEDYFGLSVDIDGETAVAGAHNDSHNGNHLGRVYVFNARTGALLRTLERPTEGGGERLGHSVAISGGRILAGAPLDGSGGERSGTAFLFDANTGAPLRNFYGPRPAPASEVLGWAVALDGDTAVAGAWGHTDGGWRNSGIAYVFNAETGEQTATLRNPSPGPDDSFGSAVAVSGNRAVAGAYYSGTGTGEVHEFAAVTGCLEAVLANPFPPGGGMGYAVAADGDWTLAGIPWVGKAVVYGSSPGTGSEAARIREFLLGLAADPSGLDVNCDGKVDVADLMAAEP